MNMYFELMLKIILWFVPNDNLHTFIVLNMYMHKVEHMCSGILFYNILKVGIVTT